MMVMVMEHSMYEDVARGTHNHSSELSTHKRRIDPFVAAAEADEATIDILAQNWWWGPSSR